MQARSFVTWDGPHGGSATMKERGRCSKRALPSLEDWATVSRPPCRSTNPRAWRWGIAECLEGFAAVAVARGEQDRAARLFGAAAALREKIGVPVPLADQPGMGSDAHAPQAALGHEEFDEQWALGATLSPPDTASRPFPGIPWNAERPSGNSRQPRGVWPGPRPRIGALREPIAEDD